MSKDMYFCYWWEIYVTNMKQKTLDTTTKTGLYALIITSKKIIHKAAEAKGEFRGNKIADKLWNQIIYLLRIHKMLKKYFTRSCFQKSIREMLKSHSTREVTRNVTKIKTTIIKWITTICLNY